MTGKLVTIEGIDGSGKTTVIDGLQSTQLSVDVYTKEPTRWSDPGKLLVEQLDTNDGNDMTELFLFMADHNEHLQETVIPALEHDCLIVSDRYIDSRCAYQGVTLDDVFDSPVEFVYNLHAKWSVFPDRTIFIDVSVDEALQRLDTDHKHETKERLESVREKYEWLMEKDEDRFVKVDGEQAPNEVIAEVADIITGL